MGMLGATGLVQRSSRSLRKPLLSYAMLAARLRDGQTWTNSAMART